MDTKHHLENTLRSLRLPGLIDNLDRRLKEANENKLGYLEFLSLIIQDEKAQRSHNQYKKLIRQANFGTEKTFESFSFSFNPTAFPESQLRDLSNCRYIDIGKNVILSGPPGIGKTHIAKALGHEACRQRKHVYFSNVNDFFTLLETARTNSHYERLYSKAVRADLLIIDDFALRKLSSKEVEIMYSVFDRRESSKSVIITSNRPTDDWINIFPDPVIGGAILDRIASSAIKLIVTKAKSYRKEGMPVKQSELDTDN